MAEKSHMERWSDVIAKTPMGKRPAPITKEIIALALCCPDKEIRCKSDTCGCREEYRDQVQAIADLFGITE